MALQTQTFAQYVNNQITQWGASLNISPALISGDPALAIFQAVALICTFVQQLIVQVQLMARLSTSTGSDVDTWVGDFGLTRLPATYATGPVTLGFFSPKTGATSIAPGVIVQTPGGAIQYQIVADTTQPAYSATSGTYVIPAGSLSITATAVALTAGVNYNVQVGQLSQLGFSAVDFVNNTASISNGINAETDAALKVRFVNYINSLSKATYGAILAAIASVQQGLNVNILENTLPNGSAQNGYFTIVVDNGTGSPPSSLLTTIFAAVNVIRAFTVQFSVIGPTPVTVTVVANIHVPTGVTSAPIQAIVQTAVINYINSLQIGQSCNLSKLTQIIQEASTNVVSIQDGSLLIQGASTSLVATPFNVFRTSSVSVSIGTF